MSEETKKKGCTPKGTGAYIINKLNMAQQIKLAEWIKARKNELQAERPKRDAVAAQAAKELGFHITETSVMSVAKATDCHWTQKADRKTNARSPFKGLKAQVACLKVQVQTLRENLIGLMDAAGHPLPDSLQAGWPNCQNDSI